MSERPCPRAPVITLYAKPPRPGESKTRLAAGVGDVLAARLASAFLEDTWESLAALSASLHARVVLATTDTTATFPGAVDLAPQQDRWDQGQGGLGERLEHIFTRGFAEGADAVMAVGADAPATAVTSLKSAFTELGDGVDATLGMSVDGGFYQLTLSPQVPLPGLFDGIPWSQPTTGRAMLDRLLAREVRVALTAPSADIDTADDLPRALACLRRGLGVAPRTLALLEQGRRAGSDSPSPSAPTLTAIVPALNEAPRIAAQVRRLFADPAITEVIVVDGQSKDGTEEAARAAGATVVVSARGRSNQLNAGARLASGDNLIFVHADCELPASAGSDVLDALVDPATVGGAFVTWHVDDVQSGRPIIKRLLHLADVRSRFAQVPYGDQAIFCRTSAFDRVGGYPAQPLMEDVEFSQRLRRHGKLVRVNKRVLVSGRRFLKRPIYYTAAMHTFPWLYRFGVTPEQLKSIYENVR